MKPFPFHKQPKNSMVCGATCLLMITEFYGLNFNLKELVKLTKTRDSIGTSLLNLSRAAKKIGFIAVGLELTLNSISKINSFPCIAHFGTNHFIVIYRIKNDKVFVADPAQGLVKYDLMDFKSKWEKENKRRGIILCLENRNVAA